MANIKNSPGTRESLLGLAFIFVFVLVAALIWVIRANSSPSSPTNTPLAVTKSDTPPTHPPGTKTSSPTPVNALSPTRSVGVAETPSPNHYPTPFKGALGINTPDGFDVVYWFTDYVVCDKDRNNNSLEIVGLIFPVGTPPYQYEFSFWRFDRVFTPHGFTPTPTQTPTPTPTYTPTLFPVPTATNSARTDLLDSRGEIIIFDQPAVLLKDEYYHVTISFKWENGNAIWIDDLYYPSTQKDPRCQ